MVTAAEARKLVQEFNDKTDPRLEYVLNTIKARAMQGITSYSTFTVSNLLLNNLRNLGYNIEYDEAGLLTVSW